MSKLGAAFFAFAILFGIGIASSVPTQAQYQNDQWRRDRAEQRRREREREREIARQQRRQNRDNDYNNDNDWNRRGRNSDGYGNYGGSYELRQTALNTGFNDGLKAGREDRNRNERFNYTDERDFQNATRGYNSRFGDRSLYQRYYREGFSHGYADTQGYGGNYGNNY
jgi:hypothetical protein